MKYNKEQIETETSQRLKRESNISLSPLFYVVSFIAFILVLFVGCSTNYQGPLRFSGNSSEQDYQSENNRFKSENRQREIKTNYRIDTLLVIDTLIEKCPLEITESTDQTEEYESCPVLFDTVTTGDLLTEAVKRLRTYFAELIRVNLFYKYVINEFMKFLEIYMPDILDRILEILKLDEIIEKQRYPEVYIYQSAYNSDGRDKPIEYSSGVQLENNVSDKYSVTNRFISIESKHDSSMKPTRIIGLDTVN